MTNPFYVVAGQSNAWRVEQRGDVQSYLEASSLEGTVISKTQKGTSIGAHSDKPDWYPFEDGLDNTGELLQMLIDVIETHMTSDPDAEFVGLLWVQGENDATRYYSADYEANLEQLILVLREHFGEEFVFTISQLADQMAKATLKNGDDNPYWKNVQIAQANIAEKYDFVSLLDPDEAVADAGFVFSDIAEDGVHYNPEGSQAIADAFMRQFESTGTADDDILYGTSINDDIRAGSGNDTVFGNAGDDTINGGDGSDYLAGNDGDDYLSGGNGFDTLIGGAGNDGLLGGKGKDLLDGGDGDDQLFGHNGGDTLLGGAGNDKLSGGGDNDSLDGGQGNDLIYGGSGSDFIFLGQGSDTVDGGYGIDTASYDGFFYLGGDVEIQTTADGLSILHGVDVDTLTSVEFIEFDDGVYNVELSTFQPLDDLLA